MATGCCRCYRREAARDITEYIEIFHNQHRRQARLGFLSPAAFEQRYYAERTVG